MKRRPPIVATIVVLAAAAAMIGLGIWQLQRARWKEGLLAQYANAQRLPPTEFPTAPMADSKLPLFRHATGVCLEIAGRRAVAGESAAGEPGFAQIVDCRTGAEGPGMSVEIGWSKNPNAKTSWSGGPVSGIIAPDRRTRLRLVASTPAPGFAASAPPSTASIPNNHRFYAAQWFAFAAIALVIYLLALRKRSRESER